MSNLDPIELLSFVKKEKAGFNYWSVDAGSLDYPQQCQLGKAMAMETLEAVRKTEFVPLLGWIILDQCRAGIDKTKNLGVLVGFAEHICRTAVLSTGREVCHG